MNTVNTTKKLIDRLCNSANVVWPKLKKISLQITPAYQRSIDVGLRDSSYFNDLTLTKLFITKGANVNFLDPKDSRTMLIQSIFNNNIEMTRLLLESGADIKLTTYDYPDTTPIGAAAVYGDVEMLQLLVDYKCDINLPFDRFRQTPLMHCFKRNNLENLRFLLDAGADYKRVNSLHQNALEAALAGHHFECSDIIKAHMQRIQSRDEQDSLMRVASHLLIEDAGNTSNKNSRSRL